MDALEADSAFSLLVDMGFDSDMAHAPTHAASDSLFAGDTKAVLTCDLVVQPTRSAKAGLSSSDVINAPMGGMLDIGGASYASSSASSSPIAVSANAAKQTDEERRKKHNANERRRTNALKTRILTMRDELAALEIKRDELQQLRQDPPATTSSGAAQSTAIVPRHQQAFSEVMRTIDHLRQERLLLTKQLQLRDIQHSAYQTVLSEFNGPSSADRDRRPVKALPAAKQSDPNEDEDKENGFEETPFFQRIIFEHDMSVADAVECVRSTCQEIMKFRNQERFESMGGEVLGWSDRRILDESMLQFMLAQKFEGVLAHELLYKTWNLLTMLKLYRRIQPQTKELKILQRVTDDCVIARVTVTGNKNIDHYSILLIARGQIDGGYLITYRSIPMTEGQRQFIESEGGFVTLFNWYMFLDTHAADGTVNGCEVTFGGKVRNQSAEYLRYLMMEIVAGVVRWQSAVGHSKFRLTH